MTATTGTVATDHASRYLQQLCKHWSHRFEVAFDAAHGTVVLPGGLLTLDADAERLRVTLDPKPDADVARMRAVVVEHLDRFAFREAPLAFDWHDDGAQA